MLMTKSLGGLGELGGFVAVVVFIGTILVHIALALGVRDDASRLRDQGRGPNFIGPAMWTIAVLMGGVLSLGVYWLIHHSTLRIFDTDKPPSSSGDL